MKTKILTAVLIVSAAFAFAQGEIQGKVFEKETNEPLMYANVYVESGGQTIGTTTDDDGRFKIKPLDAGVYTLHISYVGKPEFVMTGIIVNANKATFLKDIHIEGSNVLGELVIQEERYTGSERLIKPEDPSAMTILSTELIKSPSAKMPKSIVAQSAGVYQADEGQPLYFKGSRSDAVDYYVDGMKSIDGELNIPSSSIQEITVYTGGVPAKYGDVTGGVVVIETKNYFSLYNAHKNK